MEKVVFALDKTCNIDLVLIGHFFNKNNQSMQKNSA